MFIDPELESWRAGQGLTFNVRYKRVFALLPTKCSDNSIVWFKFYYKKYQTWKSNFNRDNESSWGHTDYLENVTEADYLIRRLAENL